MSKDKVKIEALEKKLYVVNQELEELKKDFKDYQEDINSLFKKINQNNDYYEEYIEAISYLLNIKDYDFQSYELRKEVYNTHVADIEGANQTTICRDIRWIDSKMLQLRKYDDCFNTEHLIQTAESSDTSEEAVKDNGPTVRDVLKEIDQYPKHLIYDIYKFIQEKINLDKLIDKYSK